MEEVKENKKVLYYFAIFAIIKASRRALVLSSRSGLYGDF